MKLEKYFVLNKYLLSLFGVNNFKELQQKLKDIQERIDNDGRTYFVNTLITSFNKKILVDDFLKNILFKVKKEVINYELCL